MLTIHHHNFSISLIPIVLMYRHIIRKKIRVTFKIILLVGRYDVTTKRRVRTRDIRS